MKIIKISALGRVPVLRPLSPFRSFSASPCLPIREPSRLPGFRPRSRCGLTSLPSLISSPKTTTTSSSPRAISPPGSGCSRWILRAWREGASSARSLGTDHGEGPVPQDGRDSTGWPRAEYADRLPGGRRTSSTPIPRGSTRTCFGKAPSPGIRDPQGGAPPLGAGRYDFDRHHDGVFPRDLRRRGSLVLPDR